MKSLEKMKLLENKEGIKRGPKETASCRGHSTRILVIGGGTRGGTRMVGGSEQQACGGIANQGTKGGGMTVELTEARPETDSAAAMYTDSGGWLSGSGVLHH